MATVLYSFASLIQFPGLFGERLNELQADQVTRKARAGGEIGAVAQGRQNSLKNTG